MFEFEPALSPRLIVGYKFGRSAAAAFIRWWVGELAAITPKTVVGLVGGSAGRQAVVLVRGETLLLETHGTDERSARVLDLENGGPDASVVNELKSSHAIVLEFHEAAVAFRKVRLPQAAIHKAREAIGFLLPRLTPFRQDEVNYAVRFERNDPARKEAVFELAILPKRAVEAVEARLKALGIDVHGVRVARARPNQPFEFPDAIGSSRGPRHRLQGAWKPVGLSALVVAVIGPMIVAATLDARSATLADRARALSRDAQASPELRAELSRYRNEVSFLRSRAGAVPTSSVLEALAAKAPDDSWLFSLEVTRTAATLGGYSADLPTLLNRLGTAPFSTPELIGSVIHTQNDGKDRFELRLPIESGS